MFESLGCHMNTMTNRAGCWGILSLYGLPPSSLFVALSPTTGDKQSALHSSPSCPARVSVRCSCKSTRRVSSVLLLVKALESYFAKLQWLAPRNRLVWTRTGGIVSMSTTLLESAPIQKPNGWVRINIELQTQTSLKRNMSSITAARKNTLMSRSPVTKSAWCDPKHSPIKPSSAGDDIEIV